MKMNKTKVKLCVCVQLWFVYEQRVTKMNKSKVKLCVYICDLFVYSVWRRWTRQRLSCVCVCTSVICLWTARDQDEQDKSWAICVYICDLFVNSVWPRWTRRRMTSWTPTVWQRPSYDRWQVSALPGLLVCKHHLSMFFETSHCKDFLSLYMFVLLVL